MLEPAGGGGSRPRALLRIGGTTVARQQLAIALALGCERVVCIARGLSPELIQLQHVSEAARVNFHVIAGPRLLAGLVTANDEVIALADGLFATTAQASALLEAGQAVLVQPAESGLAAGFERIDADRAAAGALRLPGRLVERIADLPADCDAISALQRIALQAGVGLKPLPASGTDGQFWTLVRSDDEAHALEPQWIRQRIVDGAPLGPSRWVARSAVRRLGPAFLHAGSGPATLAIAAAALALLALGAGWFALPALGLGICALGWVLRETAVILAKIDSDGSPARPLLSSSTGYGLLIDGIIVALAGWGITLEHGLTAYQGYFPAFMLVALLRILAQLARPRTAAWLEDRAVLALGLGWTIFAGLGSEAIHLAAALAALAGIALPALSSRLTRL